MKSNGDLERWDEYILVGSHPSQQPNAIRNIEHSKTAGHNDVDSLADTLIPRALQDFQSYHISDANDPWDVVFPFAVIPLRAYSGTDAGQRSVIVNATQGVHYYIETVFGAQLGRPSRTVRLTGGEPPKPHDRLVLPEDQRLVYHHAFPKQQSYTQADTGVDNLSGSLAEEDKPFQPTITYKIIRDEPGSVSGRPFTTPREISKRVREHVPHPLNPQNMIEIHGQVKDSLIQFDCWGRTNREVTALAHWFEDFMNAYEWVFVYNGITHFHYWNRAEDSVSGLWRNDLYSRGLVYYVRTENRAYRLNKRLLNARIDLQLPALYPTGQANPTGILSEFPEPEGTGYLSVHLNES